MSALNIALRPVRRRIRLVRMVNALDWAFCILTVLVLGLRVMLFFYPVEYPGVYFSPVLAMATLAVLAAFLWPVSRLRAAGVTDAGGLMQRALTALELADDASPMALLQRDDALKALAALDVKSALPHRQNRKRMWVAWVCMVLSGTLNFIPNPQTDVIADRQLLRGDLAEQAEKFEKAADALPAFKNEDLTAELKKLAKELAQSLRASQSSREALLRLNEAGDSISRIERQQVQKAMETASNALGAGGMKELQRALQSGDASQVQSAAQNLASGDQSALTNALNSAASAAPSGSALQAALQNAAQAAPGAAQDAALNQLAQKLSATASSASASQLKALVATAKASLGGSGSSNAKGAAGAGGSSQKGSGKGGQGQGGGSGAGMGTTNKDAGYQEGGAKRTGFGSGAPVNKTGAYEAIYDPKRLGDGGEVSQSTGKVSEGDVSRAELAPGLGEAGGIVPFAQGAHSYSQAAAKAASQPGVPDDVAKMVNAYFNALIDESEG